jgi:hypothetical protein
MNCRRVENYQKVTNNQNSKNGPFAILEEKGDGEVSAPVFPALRHYDCPNYETCLSIAIAQDWDNFGCNGCVGTPRDSLIWKSHVANRRNKVNETLSKLPEINYISNVNPEFLSVKLIGLSTGDPKPLSVSNSDDYREKTVLGVIEEGEA